LPKVDFVNDKEGKVVGILAFKDESIQIILKKGETQ